jgi:hypothetical protein
MILLLRWAVRDRYYIPEEGSELRNGSVSRRSAWRAGVSS